MGEQIAETLRENERLQEQVQSDEQTIKSLEEQVQEKEKQTALVHTKRKSEASSKTKMVKTPNKKPTQHAVVPKKGRVFRPNFDAKKKCSELQANYKKNMEKAAMCLQDAMRLRIDDTLFNIGRFMMARSFEVQDVAGCQLPECRDFQRNYSQMVQGEGDVVDRGRRQEG